jgi:hypothetical protein
MMAGRGSHGLGRDRFGAIRRSLGIAGRLLYAAGGRLRRRCCLLRLLAGCLSARGRLVGAIGRIHGALRGIRLVRACRRKRKG